MEKLKNAVSRIWEKILWRLHLVPKSVHMSAVEELVYEVTKLNDEMAAWQDMPASARETRQIVPVAMRAALYGFEEEAYFPERALQEIHTAKREYLAREIGQAMLDKGLLKVGIRRNQFSQQVEMELHAEVLE